MKKIFLSLLFLSGIFICFGQTRGMENGTIIYKGPTSVSKIVDQPTVLIGFNQGKRSMGEIGFGWFSFGGPGISFAKYASLEMGSNRTKFIMVPKIGAWAGMGTGVGLNLLYYSDFQHGTLVFRPEIGLAFWRLKLMYGYNVRLSKDPVGGINLHQVNLSYLIAVKNQK
ncbi:hypothetical protein H3C65_03810 [Patescibacteria group bacterium]|nr:hypothetical protein [Patescibacteria group bacterium]